VHIADPTRWLLPEDDESGGAASRQYSVFADGNDLNVPLGVGNRTDEPGTGPSLLCRKFWCGFESWGSTDYSIHTSLIKPTYRLTYDVDEMLDLGCRRNQKSMRSPLGQRRQVAALPHPPAGGND